tara:strand:- start:124 stop:399 length:276 start_codon:yes stop_codon:yes gene_type:complete
MDQNVFDRLVQDMRDSIEARALGNFGLQSSLGMRPSGTSKQDWFSLAGDRAQDIQKLGLETYVSGVNDVLDTLAQQYSFDYDPFQTKTFQI